MEKEFNNLVYNAVKEIPKGKVATYGQIASIIGYKYHSRQVGWALHKNPNPNIIPCHRVVFKDGSTSPSFAFGGDTAQINLLKQEGITFLNNNKVDMQKHQMQ